VQTPPPLVCPVSFARALAVSDGAQRCKEMRSRGCRHHREGIFAVSCGRCGYAVVVDGGRGRAEEGAAHRGCHR